MSSDELEAWEAFKEMRRAKGNRAPFTKKAEDRILLELKKLAAIGYPQAEVLWQSVINGWSGVFPLKLKTEAQISYEARFNSVGVARVANFVSSAIKKIH